MTSTGTLPLPTARKRPRQGPQRPCDHPLAAGAADLPWPYAPRVGSGDSGSLAVMVSRSAVVHLSSVRSAIRHTANRTAASASITQIVTLVDRLEVTERLDHCFGCGLTHVRQRATGRRRCSRGRAGAEHGRCATTLPCSCRGAFRSLRQRQPVPPKTALPAGTSGPSRTRTDTFGGFSPRLSVVREVPSV
jgi:hypothetical protein